MKRKTTRYSFIIILVILAVTIFFAYKEYNRKHDDITDMSAAYSLTSDEICAAFFSNEKAANEKYLDKVLKVNGTVKSVDTDDRGSNTIVLGNENLKISVRCCLDSSHNAEASGISKGDHLVVKGICTGFNADELLGSDVILNRCTIIK